MLKKPDNPATYRVLSIDGGGMRGFYSASYLRLLAKLANERFGVDLSDFGKQFDLIVGTSTGAILGTGLAAGVPLDKICSLYRDKGLEIFPEKLPKSRVGLLFHPRSKLNEYGDQALTDALNEVFGNSTLGSLYRDRNIGLAVPAVNCATHRAWIFKTPHDRSSNGRDKDYSLTDVCRASSAAPIYRSLAAIPQPTDKETVDLFVDGGLWAANPVLVSLIESLRNTKPGQKIEIFCMGTTPPPPGSTLDSDTPHWGLLEWQFGGKAVELALDSQSWVHDQMAGMLINHLDRPVFITRFPQPNISAEQSELLDMDDASKQSLDLQSQLASTAADLTNQLINQKTMDGIRIGKLLGSTNTLDTLAEAG